MKHDEWMNFAVLLAEDIPGTPNSDDFLERLGNDLRDLCGTKADVEWLVDEARRTWKRWQGLATLREMMLQKRNPPAEQRPFKSLGPKPEGELCPVCRGWGQFYNETEKRTEFCSCSEGDWLRNSCPSLVEGMNRKGVRTPRPQAVPRRPITQADVDAIQKKKSS